MSLFFFCIFALLYTILLHIDFFFFSWMFFFLLQFSWFVLLARFICFQKKKVLFFVENT